MGYKEVTIDGKRGYQCDGKSCDRSIFLGKYAKQGLSHHMKKHKNCEHCGKDYFGKAAWQRRDHLVCVVLQINGIFIQLTMSLVEEGL